MLAGMHNPDIHSYIQTTDLEAITQSSDEGESLPLLLTILDLAMWICIFEFTNTDSVKALERLKELHSKLADICSRDTLEYEETRTNVGLVEVAIWEANYRPPPEDSKPTSNSAGLDHPFLFGLQISEAHKAALEDLTESISALQSQTEQANLSRSSDGLAIPFIPPRAVEDLVTQKHHQVWTIGNLNLMAPITLSMWRVWANLSVEEIQACEAAAQNNTTFISGIHKLLHPFSLSLYRFGKCATEEVQILTKLDIPTAKDRKDLHVKEMWNCKRPYMRCKCNIDATNGCSGDILWWNHACRYMINHLERFFDDDNYPTLNAKLAAFMVWMARVGRQAIKSHIVFMYQRKWMTEAAIQFAAFPNAKLLDKYPDALGFRKIECLLKPASFSIANPETPSQAPAKHQRLNLNTPPSNHQPSKHSGGYPRGRGGRFQVVGRRGRRGRGTHYGRSPTPIKEAMGSPHTPHTVPAFGTGDARNSTIRTDAHIMGRILSFEEEL